MKLSRFKQSLIMTKPRSGPVWISWCVPPCVLLLDNKISKGLGQITTKSMCQSSRMRWHAPPTSLTPSSSFSASPLVHIMKQANHILMTSKQPPNLTLLSTYTLLTDNGTNYDAVFFLNGVLKVKSHLSPSVCVSVLIKNRHRRKLSYNIARLNLLAPIDFWQVSTPISLQIIS